MRIERIHFYSTDSEFKLTKLFICKHRIILEFRSDENEEDAE